MKLKAKEILLRLPEEKEVTLSFFDGEELVLKNFDMVDESIYDRSDLVCAVLVKINISDKINHNISSMIDFSISDVNRIFDPEKNSILFKA